MPFVHYESTKPYEPVDGRMELMDIFNSLQDLDLEGKIVDKEDDQLGMGFSCDVFRARLSHSKRKMVVVKRIRFFLLDDISFARSVGREVRLWSRLRHPNVLPLLGFFLEGSKAIPNLVSEYMKNGTITEYMSDRPFEAREMCEMVLGIAAGLDYIHTVHEMIHADLKGSNILVSNSGNPLLADFGLSVSSTSASLGQTTFHGQKGSQRWMAKELHANYQNLLEMSKHTTMTDMWSFGMVISELLTRNIPYSRIADRYVPAAILNGQFPEKPNFSDFPNPLTFRGLWAIASDCWDEDPSKRPTASDVEDELQIFVDSLRAPEKRRRTYNLSSRAGRSDETNVLIEQTLGRLAGSGIELSLDFPPLPSDDWDDWDEWSSDSEMLVIGRPKKIIKTML